MKSRVIFICEWIFNLIYQWLGHLIISKLAQIFPLQYTGRTISRCYVGLSDGAIPDNLWIGHCPNSYAIQIGLHYYGCRIAGNPHQLGLPGAIRPRLKRQQSDDFFGCGLVLDPENKLWIFFTFNGKLMCELASEVLRGLKKPQLYFHLINFYMNHN
jgi:hypothetical protein